MCPKFGTKQNQNTIFFVKKLPNNFYVAYIYFVYIGHVSVPNVSQWVGGCVGPPMWFDQLFSCLAELAEQSLCTFVR